MSEVDDGTGDLTSITTHTCLYIGNDGYGACYKCGAFKKRTRMSDDEVDKLIGQNTPGEALRLFSPTKIRKLIEKEKQEAYKKGYIDGSYVEKIVQINGKE